MAKVVALKCPNCGSFLERGQMKCQYCGAELVLLPDGSSLRFRSEKTCPNCGATNELSSWFCTHCNTVLTEDIEMLKEQQKKIRFERERAISTYMPSWMREKIEPDEFIYFVFKMGGNDFYAATDKRIIKNRHGKYEESSLKEVVSIGPPQVKTGIGIFVPSVTSFFEINTFHGTIVFDGFGVEDAQSCGTLNAWVNIALSNHNMRKKDVRAVILSLNLGIDYSKMEAPFESQNREAPRSYQKKCVQCRKEIPLASEECPHCNASQKNCPHCGKPIRWIEQYQRGYCDNEKKYL